MKLNAGKRILMFFHWLFSLLAFAAFTAWIVKPEWTQGVVNGVAGGLSATQKTVIGITLLAVYVLLTVMQAFIIFHRDKRTDRGFITVDSSDSGRVRIAVSAVEQMVRQSVITIDGISEMKISIENRDDAIGINIAATLQSGSHVPTITMNMQRAIRQFVEMNCGVAVRSVSISINAVTSAPEVGRRAFRRRDSLKPIEPPVYTPVEPHFDAPAGAPEAETVEAGPAASVEPASVEAPVAEYEPEADAAEAVEEAEMPVEAAEGDREADDIYEPRPIRLHFDHLPAPDEGGAAEQVGESAPTED